MRINYLNIGTEELQMFVKIDKVLRKHVHRKSDFRLFHLAFLIDYPTDKTSKILKTIYGYGFNEVVNFYRLNYFEELLQQHLFKDEKIKITELIKKSGFKSRNTYYITLKRKKNDILK